MIKVVQMRIIVNTLIAADAGGAGTAALGYTAVIAGGSFRGGRAL